jgi:RNA polymerase sigma-70 factor (ECF subfamily)
MLTTSLSLLERLRQPGERRAWDRFVELYTPLLLSWARRAGLQESDAADLVQDVFVTLVQIMPTFTYDRQKSFRAWLKTITLNKWRDRCEKLAKRPALPGGGDRLNDLAGPNDLEAFWNAEYRQHVTRQALQILQADFQPATWKAFWEHVVVGRPAPEVGRELGVTPGAVYAAKLRILGRLRDEFAGMLD